jgi:hypothetical protein
LLLVSKGNRRNPKLLVQYDEIAALTVFLFHLGLHPLFLKTGKWRLSSKEKED